MRRLQLGKDSPSKKISRLDRCIKPSDWSDGIKRVLEDISLDLNSRYSLSYYPTNKTTGWHTIKVSLTPRKQEIRLKYQQRYLVN